MVLIALIAVSLIALFTGNTLMWRLLLLCLLMTLSGYIWVRLGLSGIEIQPANLHTAYHAGQQIDTSSVLNNTSPLPKFMLRVSQHGDLPGYDQRIALNLPGGGSYTWHTSANCLRRGRYELKTPSLEINDPFGIFRTERNGSTAQTVLVYPRVKELMLTDLATRTSGSPDKSRFSPSADEDISNVREYTAGDSLSRVHWRSTAHHGRLMVKEFSMDRSRSIWIVLDMCQSQGRRNQAENEAEAAVSVAASLAKYYLEKGSSVGLISEGDTPHVLLPRPGEEHYWCLMNALAVLKPEGAISIDELLTREHGRFKAGSLVLVVCHSANAKLIGRIRQMNHKGMTVSLVVPDSGIEVPSRELHDFYNHLASGGVPAYLAS